jgi:phosphate binding protein
LKRVVTLVLSAAIVLVISIAACAVDPNLPEYEPVSGISGTIISVGSDTMNNMMALWAEGFRKHYPNVRVEIEGKGSSTAPPALISGTAQFGPMSREMTLDEIDAFEKAFGYRPTLLRVGLDALAVYVNKDNPIEGLTLAQVDAIFSKTLRCGYGSSIDTWGDLGLTDEWSRRPISLYSRNSASGTYGYFKENALCGGDYKDTVKEQPGSAAVVQGVTVDRYGIGYSGIGYATSGVRPVPLARAQGEPYIDTSTENVVSGEYPLARFLYIYINKAPGQPVSPLVEEFVKFIFSREGQEIVERDGYVSVPADFAARQVAQVVDK